MSHCEGFMMEWSCCNTVELVCAYLHISKLVAEEDEVYFSGVMMMHQYQNDNQYPASISK